MNEIILVILSYWLIFDYMFLGYFCGFFVFSFVVSCDNLICLGDVV